MSSDPDHPRVRSLGPGTTVHHTVQIFGPEWVRIGADTRIDCFAVITAGPGTVEIGDSVHVAAASMIFGTAGVMVAEGATLSGRVTIYSTTDDFTSGHLGNPQLPESLRNVRAAPVVVERHVIVGAGSILLPGVRLGHGCAVGALSLVKDDVEPHTLVAGVPARPIGRRDADQLARCEEELAALKSSA
jgi:dTDP-4-amino-4,6-dideoxy-D-glucose acyltransferase